MNLFIGLARHTNLLLTFRHDGRGLPHRQSALIPFLGLSYVLLQYLAETMLSGPQGPSSSAGMGAAVFAVLCVIFARPAPAVILFLSYIGVRVLAVATLLISSSPEARAVASLFLVMGYLAAGLGLYRFGRMMRAEREAYRANQQKLRQRRAAARTIPRDDISPNG